MLYINGASFVMFIIGHYIEPWYLSNLNIICVKWLSILGPMTYIVPFNICDSTMEPNPLETLFCSKRPRRGWIFHGDSAKNFVQKFVTCKMPK